MIGGKLAKDNWTSNLLFSIFFVFRIVESGFACGFMLLTAAWRLLQKMQIAKNRNEPEWSAVRREFLVSSNRLRLLLALALAVAPLSGCKIVQIGEQEAAAPAGFDAAGYADDLWSSQVLPYFSESARPVAEVIPAIVADLEGAGTSFGYRAGEGSPWSFVVNGTGKVTTKNTESRAGTIEVAVDGLAEPVVVQIGPVIRGNGVRDALPFVSFKDFVNQIEYANAGKALTALAYQAIGPSAETVAVGDTVTFTGAIAVSRPGDALMVTPVSLEVAP